MKDREITEKVNRILLEPAAWYLVITCAWTLSAWRNSLPNNFVIFRTAARNLVEGRDLYVSYAAEHFDLFKYSPTFAFLFLPFALLPSIASLLLFNLLSALAFTFALSVSAYDRRTYVIAAALLLWPFMDQLNGSQTNPLIVAAMVGTLVLLERERAAMAASTMMVAACVKIFPIAIAHISLRAKNRFRFFVASLLTAMTLFALPLAVTSPEKLIAQYVSWNRVEHMDYLDRGHSVMGLLHDWFGLTMPNYFVQIIGIIILLLPLLLRPNLWSDLTFRRRLLASTLMFVVLFNHQAEYQSYIIAATGLVLWWSWSGARLVMVLLLAPFMVALHPFPYLVGWLWLQGQLLGFIDSKVSQSDVALAEARAYGH